MIDIDRRWDKHKRRREDEVLAELVQIAALDGRARARISADARALVEMIRADARPGLMDVFLAEYGLSTDEGVALMCLAEALLRVPDAPTIDALIEDKIAPSNWSGHLGRSSSPLVNASTWALMLTGKVLEEGEPGVVGRLRSMVRRLGEPVIRTAVARAMREMGRHFVLGEDIGSAMARAAKAEARGFTYSYDMLGEAAVTAADAARYAGSYNDAIDAIAAACTHAEVAENPGISVKLSALHPRYEAAKSGRVVAELVPVVKALARKAARARMGLNIDAEEMDRLGLSMTLIEAVLADPELRGWEGLGVVVQAYGRRAGDVIDGLFSMAQRYDRRLMVRLVKGAYWDTEIKHAQVEGLEDFPVFTRKAASDVSYIALARRLLSMTDRLYPQFATHNAHTVSAVLHLAKGGDPGGFEFQRLHGMGEVLHDFVRGKQGTRCRIYAPVGAHRDLLAYLVRRLLENGANSSFVHQIVDRSIAPEAVAACPFVAIGNQTGDGRGRIRTGPDLFEPDRRNSKGFDLSDAGVLDEIGASRILPKNLKVGPVLAGQRVGGPVEELRNPASMALLGEVVAAEIEDVNTAIVLARPWDATARERAAILNRAADLYESDFPTLFGLLAAEAGKTLADAVAELREAVDFLRYYAVQCQNQEHGACGIFACISPWNFPLAIFTGQISAALAAGNAVLAKPAETTPAIAAWAVQKLHAAGVPATALQLLPGRGDVVGRALVSDPRLNGVAFTGSTATARRIQHALAQHCRPGTPFIAETGGLNAMIVDSTALQEQAVRDVIASAFRSAGQRCSALRCLYVQEDIAQSFRAMLIGAMDELEVGDPWAISTDVGPVITAAARDGIAAYVDAAQAEGRLIHRTKAPATGNFVAPSLIGVTGISDLEREIFGPVLHFATFAADRIGRIIDEVNGSGYGLTFGLHTRIDERVQWISEAVRAGNIYANRNQIGAVVGSQPFGGEGLSGTGPKAGGPNYLPRFTRAPASVAHEAPAGSADVKALAEALRKAGQAGAATGMMLFPGPTGELNRMSMYPRAPILCLGPGRQAAEKQAQAVRALGGRAVAEPDAMSPGNLGSLGALGGVIWWGDAATGRQYAISLANRPGPIVPLIAGFPDRAHVAHERHLCVDTTAAGGNATLLAEAGP